MHDPYELIRRAFCAIFCPCRNRVTRTITYRFNNVSFTTEGEAMLQVKDTDVPGTVTVSVTFKDSKGNPAKVDGVPTWTASDATIVDAVTPSADGLSATVHIKDTVGASQLTVNADVDLGAGTDNVDFVDTISVLAGNATAATFTFGAVTPDP